MNKNVKVSAILPVYNGEHFIDQAIRSVLDQTFEDFELIIIDDCSTDNTLLKINQFKDPRIRVIRHNKNLGIAATRNDGIRDAKGEWVAPIDADDIWHKERLVKLLKVAEEHPNSFVGSDLMISLSDRNHRLVPWKTVFQDRGLIADHLYFPKVSDTVKFGLTVLPIIPSRPLHKHTIRFQEEFSGHDWLCFYFQLFSIGLRLIIVNEPLYFYRYRLTSGSDSSTYNAILTQIVALSYLETLDWINEETLYEIKKSKKLTKYKLIAVALRNKLWSRALSHFVKSPFCIFYLTKSFFSWFTQRRRLQNILNDQNANTRS